MNLWRQMTSWRRKKLILYYDYDPVEQVLLTTGAEKEKLFDLRIKLRSSALLEDTKLFCRFVFNYQKQSRKKILPDQTMMYGFWIVKFFATETDGVIEVAEYDPEQNDFVMGLDLALKFWKEQREVCKSHKLDFNPPALDQIVYLSKKILTDTFPVTGLRYPFDDDRSDRSGWVLFNDQSDLFDKKLMESHHLYHLVNWRPDLIRFLALPVGYGFEINRDGHEVFYNVFEED